MRALFLLPCLGIAGAASAAEPITGRWLTDDGKAIVTIAPCGSAICGHITRILAPTPKGPPVDEYNPDPRLRKRPILGLAVLTGFVDKGADWRGRIYSPEEGKWYKSILRRNPDGSLKAQGCILFFCKTQRWKAAR